MLKRTGKDKRLVRWSRPTSTYENWGGGEPNDAGGEDCAFLSGGTWNDNDCSGEGREWICE